MRFRLPTSRMMISTAFSTSRPGSVTRLRRLPWRAKMSMPSSSSSSRIALLMPGCEVNSALAVSVRFRLRRTASCTKRNWCRFIFGPAPRARCRPSRAAASGARRRPAAASSARRAWRARRVSSNGGRSLRRWPPVPRNSGRISTRVQPAAASFAPAVGQVGLHHLQIGQLHRQGRAQRRTCCASNSKLDAHRGSREPCANRISPGRFIGAVPARRTRPATSA